MFKNINALVLEDHPHMQLMFAELLRELKIDRVKAVESVADAQHALRLGEFGFALVDIGLGNESGLDFIRGVRADRRQPHRRIPMLVISGQSDRESILAARDSGADGFLMKPFSSGAFTERLTKTLTVRQPFVESETYFGPDRRRSANPTYCGPERRSAFVLG